MVYQLRSVGNQIQRILQQKQDASSEEKASEQEDTFHYKKPVLTASPKL